jgi:hypothetical protein
MGLNLKDFSLFAGANFVDFIDHLGCKFLQFLFCVV